MLYSVHVYVLEYCYCMHESMQSDIMQIDRVLHVAIATITSMHVAIVTEWCNADLN